MFMLEHLYFSETHHKTHLTTTTTKLILPIIQPSYFWTDLYQTAIINPHHCLQQHHQQEWGIFMVPTAVWDILNISELSNVALLYRCWMYSGKMSTNTLCLVAVHNYSFCSIAICISYVQRFWKLPFTDLNDIVPHVSWTERGKKKTKRIR